MPKTRRPASYAGNPSAGIARSSPTCRGTLTVGTEPNARALAPQDSDLVDVYRRLHPDGTDHSWVWRGHGRELGRRFDHVLASRALPVRSLAYRHDWRMPSTGARLSDHSGVVVEFASAR